MLKRIVISSLLLSSVVFAAPSQKLSTTYSTTAAPKYSVMFEGDSLIFNGVGVKGTYKYSDKIALGATAKKLKMKSDKNHETETGNSFTHDMTILGTFATYFPWTTYDRSGMYLTGGLNYASVKTETQDEFYGEGGSSDSSLGAEAKLGYQFVTKVSQKFGLIFQLGLGYGNGGGVRWSMRTGENTKIGNSLLLDLTAGMQF